MNQLTMIILALFGASVCAQENSISKLNKLLEVPASGAFSIDGTLSEDVPSNSELDSAVLYVRSLIADTNHFEDADGYINSQKYIPSIVHRMKIASTTRMQSSELLVLDGSYWADSFSFYDKRRRNGVLTETTYDSLGLSKTQRINGDLVYQKRLKDDGELDRAVNSLFSFLMIASTAKKILKFGTMAPDSEQARLSYSLAFESMETLAQFSRPPILPLGFGPIAGRVLLIFDTTEYGHTLALRWQDKKGRLVHYDELAWPPESVWPEIERVDFLPGSTKPVLREKSRVQIVDAEAVTEEFFRWKPAAGVAIHDFRFGPPLPYFAESNGSVPSDETLRRRLESLIAKSGIEESVLLTSLIPNSKELNKDTEGNRENLVPEKSLLYLGEYVVGDVASFAFKLMNKSDQPLQVGKPKGDCSCLDVTVDRALVNPGDSAVVRGLRRIKTLGPERSQILIEVGDGELLVLELEVKGREGITINLPGLETSPWYIPSIVDDEFEMSAVVGSTPGYSFSLPQAIEVSGQLIGQLTTIEPLDNGEVIYSGTVYPSIPKSFGILRGNVRASDQVKIQLSLDFVADLIPLADGVPLWESSRVLVPLSSQRSKQVRFRGVTIQGFSLGDGTIRPSITTSEDEGVGSILSIDFDSAEKQNRIGENLMVHLSTSIGNISIAILLID